MALSTITSDGGSWTTPVHFEHGPKLELYFVSQRESKHVANILNDARVSVAIYHPDAMADGSNMGLQIKGTAKVVSGDAWMRFEITPEEVWCYDSRVSGSSNKIDLTKLNI